VVHRTMATSSWEISCAGPLMISTCLAFGAGEEFWARAGLQQSKQPAKAVAPRISSNLFHLPPSIRILHGYRRRGEPLS
jgi:hypothetical protein